MLAQIVSHQSSTKRSSSYFLQKLPSSWPRGKSLQAKCVWFEGTCVCSKLYVEADCCSYRATHTWRPFLYKNWVITSLIKEVKVPFSHQRVWIFDYWNILQWEYITLSSAEMSNPMKETSSWTTCFVGILFLVEKKRSGVQLVHHCQWFTNGNSLSVKSQKPEWLMDIFMCNITIWMSFLSLSLGQQADTRAGLSGSFLGRGGLILAHQFVDWGHGCMFICDMRRNNW